MNIKQFLYDFEMKPHEQNGNNKWTEIERFDWFIERIQMHVAFGCLSECLLGYPAGASAWLIVGTTINW